jgi:hypothetical protein
VKPGPAQFRFVLISVSQSVSLSTNSRIHELSVHELSFGAKSYEDPQRGADFARGPVRQVADRPNRVRCLRVPVVAMRLKAGGRRVAVCVKQPVVSSLPFAS